MKKIAIIFLVVGVLVVSAYLVMRYSLRTGNLKPAQASAASIPVQDAKSALDLRPKLVEKLQQIIRDGSNGLYHLSVGEADPDILASTLTLKDVSFFPDSAGMNKLMQAGTAPEDVISITTDSIFVSGIGVKDILSKDVIDLKRVFIHSPVITITKYQIAQNDTTTLYQRILKQLKRFAADEVIITKAKVISRSWAGNKTTLNDVELKLSNVLIDSSTQYDKNRFLFSEEGTLSTKNYAAQSKDGMYDFKIDEITISTKNQLLAATGISLQPRYEKQEFGKKAKTAKERYDLLIPEVRLKNTDWRSLANKESIVADEATIPRGSFDVYLDRTQPQVKSKVGNYPHQLLMKLPMKINVGKVKIEGLDFSYEEFNPASGKSGKLFIDNMQGTITNLTNMPAAIKRNHRTTVDALGVFMRKSTADLNLVFELNGWKKGDFAAKVNIKGFDGQLINPVAEPIGLFSIKKGTLKELTAKAKGNNNSASGTVLFLYDDLKIAALEKDGDKPKGLDKKDFTSFVANTFLVKEQNPARGKEPRKADCSFTRDPYGSFFNLVWKTCFVGILKTTGLPEKLAYKK